MPNAHLVALILGIDPGLDLNKPMAMTLVQFREDGTRHLLSWWGHRCLITFLKERAKKHEIRVELVHPSSVKLHATGYGASTTPEVAMFVRSEYVGADELPNAIGEQYDLEMAMAIAGAGYAILQKEALEALADEE